MLTYEPTSFRTDTTWCHAIDWAAVNARPLKCKDEDYGLLWSRRLLLDYNGGEIEFGFVSPAWADVHPVDTGTRRVIADRCRVLHDPRGLLKRLCAAVDRRVERRDSMSTGSPRPAQRAWCGSSRSSNTRSVFASRCSALPATASSTNPTSARPASRAAARPQRLPAPQSGARDVLAAAAETRDYPEITPGAGGRPAAPRRPLLRRCCRGG
jgi:hypothetical protein